MRTSGHVDWWAVTYPASANPLELLPQLLNKYPFKENGVGPHGYNTRLENEIGVTVYRDGSKQQGQHVILTGETMAQYHSDGGTDRALCLAAVSQMAKASRLDVAVDVYDSVLTIPALVEAVKDGTVKTRARASKHIEQLMEDGETVYIGSPSSNRLFRAYNKGYEQKTDDNWIRLELQLKKMYAQAVMYTMAAEDSTRDVINRAITDFVDFPQDAEYQAATVDRAVNLPKIPRKMTSTYKWLIDIVAPAMAKYDAEHPEDGILESFLTAFYTAQSELSPATSGE